MYSTSAAENFTATLRAEYERQLEVANDQRDGYEDAPATKMLATHCCVCSRPLLDALSVEVGMGPVCREKHGYNTEVAALDEAVRTRANQLIHYAALHFNDDAERATACAALRLIGCNKVADRIEYRGKDAPARETITMRVSSRNTGWYVRTPYKPAAVPAWQAIPGRQWSGNTKENFVPWSGRRALWELLQTHFAGYTLDLPGTGNPTTIPALEH